jgi:hypothetical protein
MLMLMTMKKRSVEIVTEIGVEEATDSHDW